MKVLVTAAEVNNYGTLLLDRLPDPAVNIDPRHIHAVGMLLQINLVGDGMRVFDALDKLMELFDTHSFDPGEDDLCNLLHCWREEGNRTSAEERMSLTVRTCGLGSADNGANTAFVGRWNEFVAAVSDYMDDVNSTMVREAKQIRVHEATFSLQANLDSAVTGRIGMQINDCAAQLAKAIEILNHPEVLARFAAGNEKNIWSVAATILPETSPEHLKPNFDAAEAIRIVFDWLERFPDQQALDQLQDPGDGLFIAMEVIQHPHDTALPTGQKAPAPAS